MQCFFGWLVLFDGFGQLISGGRKEVMGWAQIKASIIPKL